MKTRSGTPQKEGCRLSANKSLLTKALNGPDLARGLHFQIPLDSAMKGEGAGVRSLDPAWPVVCQWWRKSLPERCHIKSTMSTGLGEPVWVLCRLCSLASDCVTSLLMREVWPCHWSQLLGLAWPNDCFHSKPSKEETKNPFLFTIQAFGRRLQFA